MTKVRKVVIPAAGLGTRGLPFTKEVPKELLPIIDTPALHYIVEEAVGAARELKLPRLLSTALLASAEVRFASGDGTGAERETRRTSSSAATARVR